MPRVATIRSVTHQREAVEEIEDVPKFENGDYVEKWNGSNCTIRGVRFNHDRGEYEYLDGGILSDGWMLEATLSKA